MEVNLERFLAPTGAWRYVISSMPVGSHDAHLRYKTTWRAAYDARREEAARELECDEVIIGNARGELCEGSRGNLFVELGSRLLTPAASSGLLPGCLRHDLLASGRCREAMLHPGDLAMADRVYSGNSLRGLVRAVPAATMPSACRSSTT